MTDRSQQLIKISTLAERFHFAKCNFFDTETAQLRSHAVILSLFQISALLKFPFFHL